MSSITAVSMAEAVRGAMKDAGINQRELSERTDIPLTTLTRRLAGRGGSFVIWELFVISQCVGVGLVELVTRGAATA